MNIFQLIKSVLDDEYNEIEGTEAEKDASITACFPVLTHSYLHLTDASRSPPDYKSPVTRFAYIYKYTTCHANMVAEKIQQVPELAALLSRDDWIEVACIGGGPGSDFLGVVKHMIRHDCTGNLKCYLLDREPAWGDSWSNVEKRTTDLDFRVSTHAQMIDVTDSSTWEAEKSYLRADLFTFIYFISEVWCFSDAASEYFHHVLQRAKPGSMFLYVDSNTREEFYGFFDGLAADAGLHLVASGSESYQLDPAEEKTHLEPYLSRLSHRPKLGSGIAWRVYRKPG